MKPALLLGAAALLVATTLAGCANVFQAPPPPEGYARLGFRGTDATGANPDGWPRLDGQDLVILDHGAFSGFADAKAKFENLTGAHVTEIKGHDAGGALEQAIQAHGHPEADVIYGVDNSLLFAAVDNDTLLPYKPLLADRIAPSLVFFNASGPWYATPVDHGYIAINVDRNNTDNHDAQGRPVLQTAPIQSFADVSLHAGQLVTEDPRLSTPGLGFLLSTIQVYGTDPNGYPWQSYWRDLLAGRQVGGNCAVSCIQTGQAFVTCDWTTAYEQHYSGGYGAPRYDTSHQYHGHADRAMVVSYTESPAYEVYYGHPRNEMPDVLYKAPNTAWHQIQTMAILKGTPHLAAAQAWVEWSLTDAFQSTRASLDAVYPVVPSIDTAPVYHGLDPAPGSFPAAQMDWQTIGRNLPTWLREWETLSEANGGQQCS
ncbi:MAG: hypothetical protein ACYDBQ_08470 [Thermoplasmatota archaeon]